MGITVGKVHGKNNTNVLPHIKPEICSKNLPQIPSDNTMSQPQLDT